MLERVWRKGKPLTLLVGMQTSTATMENSVRSDQIRWIIEKAREFQKNIYSALLTMPKPLTVWITKNCGKF